MVISYLVHTIITKYLTGLIYVNMPLTEISITLRVMYCNDTPEHLPHTSEVLRNLGVLNATCSAPVLPN